MDYMKYFKRTDIVKIFEEVCKTECIYPEKLSCNGCMVRKIFDNIDELPAADVEEVIRCKDCKYFNLNKWGEVNGLPLVVAHEICSFWGSGCKTNSDAYCSFAERQESCLIEGGCE